MIIDKLTALDSLVPSANFEIRGDTIISHRGKDVPSDAEIDAELKRLQTEHDAQAYARARMSLFPDIGDQLDDLYHKGAFSTEMEAKIKKVKDDNPKPK